MLRQLPGFRIFCNQYEWAHQEGIAIHDAHEIANQRISGRQLGVDIHVKWHPGQDEEIDMDARWLLQHGPANGVYVEIVE